MREILFRGKRLDNGEWVYGNYCGAEYHTGEGIEHLIIEVPRDGASIKVDPETVGQYTGLKDKNGKRIFEGDIVHFRTRVDTFKSLYVRWYEEDAIFIVSKQDGVRSYPMSRSWEYEIIGNIHDNPGLLGGNNG